METAARLSPWQRDRTLQRIRSITVGAAIAGAAASGAFGYLAFLTNPGSQVNADSATDDTRNGAVPFTDAGSGASSDQDANSGSDVTGSGNAGSRQTHVDSGSNGSGTVNSGSRSNTGLFSGGSISHSHARRAHATTGGS